MLLRAGNTGSFRAQESLYVLEAAEFGAEIVLNGDHAAVLMGDFFTIIDLSSGGQICAREFDTYCTSFGLYLLKDGYLAVTEGAVVKTDFSGNVMWKAWGGDIFANPDPGKSGHALTDEYIELYDFSDTLYRFNLSTGETWR